MSLNQLLIHKSFTENNAEIIGTSPDLYECTLTQTDVDANKINFILFKRFKQMVSTII